MKVLAIVQARLGSSRLPEKVLKNIVDNFSLIDILLARLELSEKIDQIVVATSNNPIDQKLVDHVESLGYESYVGDEQNVLNRFYETAKFFNGEIIVRITGDCPIVSGDLVDQVISRFPLILTD